MIKILLIDDIKDNVMVLDMVIERYMEDNDIQQYEILSATDPEIGLGIAQDQDIDIIFLDVMMPKLDGFEVLELIRNDPNIAKQPIIIMATALDDHKTIKQTEKYDANACIVKPIQFKTITSTLDKYLS